MSIESVMPSNHFILCRPLLLLPSTFPSIRIFSNEFVLHIRWPKYWSYSFSSSHAWMWELDHKESWTPMNWCFELWCWGRLLKVPWTVRRSNQSILKEISPEYSLEGLTLKLKFQYFGHLMWRIDSLEKILMLGKTEGRRRRGQQKTRWSGGITTSMDMSLSKLHFRNKLIQQGRYTDAVDELLIKLQKAKRRH